MSTPGHSPTNPAGAGGAPALDGMELARRMIEATESAARAAEAAAQAVQQQASPTRSSEDKSWWRLLPKPPSFDHASREQEIAAWKEWLWTLEQYLSSLNVKYLDDIKQMRLNLAKEVDTFDFNDEDRQRNSFLYGLFSLVRQRAFLVVKQVAGCTGLEAYRLLVQQNEPVSKNRSMGLLNVIMNWAQFTNKSSLMSQVLRLEHAYSEYEKLGQPQPLGDELKTAVLLRSVTGQLKTWLQLQVRETTTYSQIREMVISYDTSTTKWSEQMVLGLDSMASSSEGPVPMEVDRISKGKDKGKGKYKGSKGYKGDSNGYFNQKGQKGKTQMNQNSKGKGKGGNNASFSGFTPKGVKGKDFSKGKSKNFGKQASTCNVCILLAIVGREVEVVSPVLGFAMW